MSLAMPHPQGGAMLPIPCNTIGLAEGDLCNATDDMKTDCYEPVHSYKKIRSSTSGLRKSPNKWTKEENQKLAALVAHYGEKKWKRISAEMGGQKTGAQCAQHWKRVLSPEIRKGHWDENEEDLLLRLVVQYGSSWKKIAKRIPQRTDIQCRYQYLKAKQSREVKWDMKEDETLIKKVMEMANCNFFKHGVGDSPPTGGGQHPYPTPLHHAASLSPLATSPIATSPRGTSPTGTGSPNSSGSPQSNKENEGDNHLHSSSNSDRGGSDISDDRSSSEESCGDGEDTPDGGWSSRSDASMKDSPEIGGRPVPIPRDIPAPKEALGSPAGFALSKVVWLEIAEHMARMKLTSTLRTALECKTRFMELLGNIMFSEAGGAPHPISSAQAIPPPQGMGVSPQESKLFHHLKGCGDLNMNPFPSSSSPSSSSPKQDSLRASSSRIPAPMGAAKGGEDKDTNINISINNNDLRPLHPPLHPHLPHHALHPLHPLHHPHHMTNNNITITNCSRNITINITNNHPALPPTPLIAPSFHLPSALPIKQEASKAPPTASSSFPSFPSFPSFSHHFPPVGQMTAVPPPALKPLPPRTQGSQAGGVASVGGGGGGGGLASGLESLAAVASILPREMLAEHYGKF